MAAVTKTFRQRKRRQQQAPKSKVSAKSSISPAVHKDLKILKTFDLTLEYGPCIGITRLERWERADKHGLNPPAEVKDIVSRHKDDKTYTECLWNDYSIL